MRRTMERLERISLGYGILTIIAIALIAVIVFGNRAAVVSLLASSASSLGVKPGVLFFTPHDTGELALGATADIDIQINTRVPINALGASITFTPETLEIVGINKATSFLDLWTEDTTIKEEAGTLHFSGGTTKTGGHTGIGTILTLTVRAKHAGHAELTFTSADVFAHDGRGTAIERDVRTLAYTISEPAREAPRVTMSNNTVPMRPNPDLNNDGRITIADISILAIQFIAPYNARYDLNADGSVGLSDMSILFARVRGE